jgi:hypothetical protein
MNGKGWYSREQPQNLAPAQHSQKGYLRLKEYESLMDEKRRLDQQKQSLDAEPDSIMRTQRIEEHNRQMKEYSDRLSNWNADH